MKPLHRSTLNILCLLGAMLFGATSTVANPVVERWYSVDEVAQGKTLFLSHCASCHGQSAEGTAEWRKTDANGNYPPPPLNGSAHGWHHSLSVLEQTIAMGGARFGGVMPGFSGELSSDEARTTIAYFQSFWPEDVYLRWHEINIR